MHDKLKLHLGRRGVALPTTVIAGLLSANAIQAAPALVVTTAAGLAVLQGSSAAWILLNAPGGVEVGPAAEIILSEHAASSNLVFLCQKLVRARFTGEKALLRAVLEQNPHDTVKAHACYALATLLRDEAATGGNLTAEAEAEQLFERVVTDFGEVTSDGMLLADRADRQLADLQRRKLDRNGVIRRGQ